jgi:hypothetical protein
VTNLLTLEQKFSKRGTASVEVESIRYFKSLPPNDYDQIPASAITNTPSEARYVEIKVKPETVSTIFPPNLSKGIVNVTLEAKSVAGLDQTVCGVAPVFVCNPFEGTNTSIYEALENPA